ncbi:MAG: DUF4397 domain-containing protein, partial [Clostridia bacterium]|nr:DUF4397 domain-containing protein [Clostridia bacterium]
GLQGSQNGMDRAQPQDFYSQSYDYGIDRGRWRRAYARMIHLAPNTPPVDVYLDGKLFYGGLYYKMQTEYVGVRPGNHRVTIYPSGQRQNPVLLKTVFIPKRSIVTLAIYGLIPNLDIMVVDDSTTLSQGRAKVKFVHLSTNAPAVDVIANQAVWFNSVYYQESTEYIPVRPGSFNIQLRVAGTNRMVLNVPNISFARGKSYTLYAIGLVGAYPPLQLLITNDGSG